MNRISKKKLVGRYLSLISAVFILSIFAIVAFIFIGYQNKLKKFFVNTVSKEFSSTISHINRLHKSIELSNSLEASNPKIIESTQDQIETMDEIMENSMDQIEYLEKKIDDENFEYKKLSQDLIGFYQKTNQNYEKYQNLIQYLNSVNIIIDSSYEERIAEKKQPDLEEPAADQADSNQEKNSSSSSDKNADKEGVTKASDSQAALNINEMELIYQEIYENISKLVPPKELREFHQTLLQDYRERTDQIKLQKEAQESGEKQEKFNPDAMPSPEPYKPYQDVNPTNSQQQNQTIEQIYNEIYEEIQNLNQTAVNLKQDIVKAQKELGLKPLEIEIDQWKI
ncbi:MAG: hypothetical protein GF335_00430 [Candidatus Moranbacteria bacterium]|nr:hypothetical protein [Candidatus Moranbacteria bacterium]